MARLTVTIGEFEVHMRDASLWLGRFRLRRWVASAHTFLDRVAMDAGDLVSQTQIANKDAEDDCDEDCDCKAPHPSIGFRSLIGGE